MSNSDVTVNISQFRTNTPTIATFVGRNTVMLGFTTSIRTNSLGHEVSDIASRSQLNVGLTILPRSVILFSGTDDDTRTVVCQT